MWNADCGTEGQASIPHSALRIPHLSAVKHRRLFGAPGGREAEMSVCGSRGAPAARRAGEEALLHQERLVHLFECAWVLAHRCGDGRESHPPALELLDDGFQDPAVHV